MNKLIAGLILLAIGLWGMASWWWFLLDVIKGLAVVGLFIIGLILIGLGVRNITNPTPEPGKSPKQKA